MENYSGYIPSKILLVSKCLIKKDGKILLLHRTKETRYNPAKWELPGGKVESWQDFERAVEKEILEETGLLVKISSPGAFAEGKLVDHNVYTGMLYLELVFEAKLISGNIRLSSDHSEYKWIEPNSALDLDLSIEARKAITFFLHSN